MIKKGQLFYYNKEDLTNFSKHLALNLIKRRDLPLFGSESDKSEVDHFWKQRKRKPISRKMKDVVHLYESSIQDSKWRFLKSIKSNLSNDSFRSIQRRPHSVQTVNPSNDDVFSRLTSK